jgi:SRSO17 transposase
VAVSVSLAHAHASVPVAYRLYLPEVWAKDRRRRRAAGVPDALAFRPKWQMALEQVAQLTTDGVPAAPVVADAGYGVVTAFRDALTAHGMPYMVGISTETTVWAPGRTPLPAPKYRGVGRPPTLVRRTRRHRPLRVTALAQQLPTSAWRTVTWRQGTRGPMRSRFAAVRVRPAHRDDWRSTPRPEEWLLIEWPRTEPAPIKYWLLTLPATATRADLVRLAMLRWRIERDYQELKDELGLDHFEGRGWRRFHHHASLCIAPMRSWPRSGWRISPLRRWPSSAPLVSPQVSCHGALPVRPERHAPDSIATMYRLLAWTLARGRPCLACGRHGGR